MKRLTIIGHLGADPQLRSGQKGNFVTFSVAVYVGTKDKDKTDWLDVSCGEKLGETVMKRCKKGSKVYIEGFPTSVIYTTRDGGTAISEKVFANILYPLDKSDEGINVDTVPEHNTAEVVTTDETANVSTEGAVATENVGTTKNVGTTENTDGNVEDKINQLFGK